MNRTVSPAAVSAPTTTSMISYFSSTLMPLVGSSSSTRRGLGGDRHGDVEQLAHALRQRARERVAIVRDPVALERSPRHPRAGGAVRSGRQSAPAPRRAIPSATAMLSSTVMVVNTCATWNERQTPSLVISRGVRSVMSWPSNRIRPELGFR